MKVSSVLGLAAVAVGAWWLYRRFAAPAAVSEATPPAGQPARRLVRRAPAPPAPRPAAPVPGAIPPKPPDSDPRFQAALEQWQATQAPGYVGIPYGRPFWRWTGSAWTVTHAV